jgi:hypothetical protein
MTNTVYYDTWQIPPIDLKRGFTQHDIDAIIPGDTIKIKNSLGEKFWVVFFQKTEEGEYIGKVNNHLILPSPYNFDSLVCFKREHIWDFHNIDHKINSVMPNVLADIAAFHEKHGRIPNQTDIDNMNIVIKY